MEGTITFALRLVTNLVKGIENETGEGMVHSGASWHIEDGQLRPFV